MMEENKIDIQAIIIGIIVLLTVVLFLAIFINILAIAKTIIWALTTIAIVCILILYYGREILYKIKEIVKIFKKLL